MIPSFGQPGSAQKRKRRVPDDQRQRVETSCDRCKQRKSRCVRREGNLSDCIACMEAAVTCQSTLPRKPKRYGPVSTATSSDVAPSADRMNAMERVLRMTYPAARLDTATDILQLCAPSTLADDVLPVLPEPYSRSPAQHASPAGLPPYLSVTEFVTPEGHFLPSPMGGSHYVGPAGSGQFANTIRSLVAKRNAITVPSSDAQLAGHFRAVEFLQTPVVRTMDATLPFQHPAVTVTAAEDHRSAAHTSQRGANIAHNINNVFSPELPIRPSALDRFAPCLPERQLADRLFHAFFSRVHPNFPLFHRGVFQIQYESLWTPSSGPLFGLTSIEVPGWIATLSMIFVFGAQIMESENLAVSTELQERYLKMVIEDGFQRFSLVSTVSNVQATLLLSLYLYNAGQRNASWLLLGQAVRMAIALGLHRAGDGLGTNMIERNVRRLTWWTCHLFEQNISFALGRPGATSSLGATCRLPDESFIEGSDHPPLIFEYSVAFARIAHRVKRFVAAVSNDYSNGAQTGESLTLAESLYAEVDTWLANCPTHLQPSYHCATPRIRRAVLLFHIHAQHIRSVIGRPLLLCRTNREIENNSYSFSTLPGPDLDPRVDRLAAMSLHSARSVLGYLLELFQSGDLDGETWVDLYYSFHAVLILCLPFTARPYSDTKDDPKIKEIMAHTTLALKGIRKAPTYRILSDVALGLSTLVGFGTDSQEKADSNEPPFPDTTQVPSLDLDLAQLFGYEPQDTRFDVGTAAAEPINEDIGLSFMMLGSEFWDMTNTSHGSA